jgi:hypothetical protein
VSQRKRKRTGRQIIKGSRRIHSFIRRDDLLAQEILEGGVLPQIYQTEGHDSHGDDSHHLFPSLEQHLGLGQAFCVSKSVGGKAKAKQAARLY